MLKDNAQQIIIQRPMIIEDESFSLIEQTGMIAVGLILTALLTWAWKFLFKKKNKKK